MKKLLLISLIGMLLLSGCGTSGNNDNDRDDDDERQEVEMSESEEDEEEELSLFAELPDSFTFSSGVGAWATGLNLNDDGTFTGSFYDSNMGETGEDHPYGTVYYCNFKGKFSEPKQINEYVYSTTIEELILENDKGDYIEEQVKYIASEPYGLNDAGKILIYLYGTPREQMEEDFISWTYEDEMGPDSLQCYGIYNVNGGDGFVGYKLEKMSELKKIDGKYMNENGDELIIYLSAGLEEYDYDLGECEWTPNGGETEVGTIKKNRQGGFTIYLDESIVYNFEITSNLESHIEITCVDRVGSIGIFEMQ